MAAVPGALLLIAVVARMRRSDHLDARTRNAWTLLVAGASLYWLGTLARFASIWGSLPFLAPLSPILETATYPVIWIALSMLPRQGRSRYDIALFTLDIAIAAWSAFILTWHFVMFPLARQSGAGEVATAIAVAYPVADVALIWTMLALVRRGLRASTQAALLAGAAGFAFAFCGDIISGTEAVRGNYTPGGWSGLFYSGAWAWLALGGLLQLRIREDARPLRGLVDYARSVPVLPYVAVTIAFAAPAIRSWNDPDMLRQHIPATGFLMALVVARMAVTARQNASLAVAERERLAAAVEQAAEAMLTTDGAGRITYVNRAFSRITGYSPEQAIGRRASFLREDANPDVLAEMDAALARGDSWTGRLTEGREDGGAAEVDLAIAPLRDAAGSVIGTVEVARDISRERALEDQLAQSQRMEAVGRLAGGVAHDFNNILTVISGFTEMAANDLGPDHPVAANLAEILKASDRAANITRALLAFARQAVMQPRPIDLNEVLAGLTPMLNLLVGEDVALSLQPAPDLGAAVADRAQFEQVILNLATNARDAMPKGGKLTISTANVELDAARAARLEGATAGPHVRLSVVDTGSGMTRDVLSHAFEPFFTTKARGKGTGLGLSTVIGVVQGSGGVVDVESRPGHGTTFAIYLPRIEGEATTEDVSAAPAAQRGGTETVLIAEDEEAVRVFVERVLSRAGYRVIAAANGPEALALAADMPAIDLLFTDMIMPGMTGMELSDNLTAAHPGMRTIVASGYSDDAPELAGGGAISGYLSKPFNREVLLRSVREVLDRPA